MGIITIAFDDGYKETFETCAEYLKENNIRTTFAIPAAFIGKTLENRPVIGRDQILSLLEGGSEIASHTKSHLNLLDLFNAEGEEAVRSEMTESRKLIKSSLGTKVDSLGLKIDLTGIEIDSMVFPFIEANQEIRL